MLNVKLRSQEVTKVVYSVKNKMADFFVVLYSDLAILRNNPFQEIALLIGHFLFVCLFFVVFFFVCFGVFFVCFDPHVSKLLAFWCVSLLCNGRFKSALHEAKKCIRLVLLCTAL